MRYFPIQSRNICIPLQSKDGIWRFGCLGVIWETPESMERYLAMMILGMGRIIQAKESFRQIDPTLSDKEVVKMIETFIKNHPVQEHQWSWDEIECISDLNTPLLLPNPFGYRFELSYAEKNYLLDILLAGRDTSERKSLEEAFEKLILEKGVIPQRNAWMNQAWQLTASFLIQHGINPFEESAEEHPLLPH